MPEKPKMSFVVTSAPMAKRKRIHNPSGSAALRFERLTSEPQDLWPSQRGSEIGHIEARFDSVETALRRLTSAKDGAVYEYPGRDLRAILLKGLAGQRMVTIVEEASLSPGMLSVVADAKADASPILDALRKMLADVGDLRSSAPDQPFTV
jgi:hypothetical protein